jgi:cation:H+ antiporter
MATFMMFLFLFFGTLCLFIGAEALIRGAVSLSLRQQIPKVIVGLTVVSIATSSPELVVSIKASLDGLGDIAVGNVVGSNSVNIGLILGVSALIYPIQIHRRLVEVDGVLMVFFTALCCLTALLVDIPWWIGPIYLSFFVAYVLISFFYGKHEEDFEQKPTKSIMLDFILVIGGTLLLVLGGHFFLKGAIALAQMIGVSEGVIALTIVAVGTSLPELATSVLAAYRRQSDIALGNVIGSNIFNIVGVLGAALTCSSITIKTIGLVDLLTMLAFTLILFGFLLYKQHIKRLDGALLIVLYAAYIFYLYTIN